MANVKSVFIEYVPVKFDRVLLKKVLEYRDRFMRSSEDTINFLGGNLIGVYSFKWLEEDRLTWIEDILNIDDIDGLREEINSNTGINKDYFVSSDVTNLSFVWVAHMALTSPHLNDQEAMRMASAAIDMLQFKFLSSIHTRWFKYKANEGIAKAAYESLDKKSMLKKYGTWGGLLHARTEDILSTGGLHFKTLRKFDDDVAITKMLNDIQGRLKAVMVKLTDTFKRIQAADAKIQSTTKFTTGVDGETMLKESSNKYERIRNNLHLLIPSRNDFIKDPLMDAITKTVTTVNKNHLEETLQYISDNYNSKVGESLKLLVDDIIVYAFDVIRHEKMSLDHIPGVMIKLRNMYRSSRVNDPLLISIRDRSGEVVEDAKNSPSKSIVVSTRIGVILYIVLRGLLIK